MSSFSLRLTVNNDDDDLTFVEVSGENQFGEEE